MATRDDLLSRLGNLSDESRAALEEMIREYDRAMEDERRFRDRPTAADRTAAYSSSGRQYFVKSRR